MNKRFNLTYNNYGGGGSRSISKDRKGIPFYLRGFNEYGSWCKESKRYVICIDVNNKKAKKEVVDGLEALISCMTILVGKIVGNKKKIHF